MVNYKSDLEDFTVDLVAETERAWLFDFGTDELWVPKSVGEYDGDTVTLPMWFVRDKGLG